MAPSGPRPTGPLSETRAGTAAEWCDQALTQAFAQLYRRLKGNPVPPFSFQFYPYTSLKHTIRVRQGQVFVRVSDILADAPGAVLRSVLAILLFRLFHRTAPEAYRRPYLDYVGRPRIRKEVLRVRSRRGVKRLTSSLGKVFDLKAIFRQLNRDYFDNQVQARHLSWSPRSYRRALGHYDPAHQAIVLNRRLDHPLVPEYVVCFVVYHEMLHAFLGEQTCNGHRRVHHRDFRQAEKSFEDYDRARAFIDTELAS
ncbi:MAG: SprT-like domain-containing protein [Acidobacteriota bacterium]